MFTGIVQGLAHITHIDRKENLNTITIRFPNSALINVQKGASIAINGTCLTVTSFDAEHATFDVMQESLKLTNLGQLEESSRVNYERAARIGDEIGGHLTSGHIHSCISICRIEDDTNRRTVWFETPKQWLRYILPKGFVALNGCSLTIGDVQNNRFNVHLIPETLSMTTFGQCQVGDQINLEVDPQTQTIVDTIERLGINLPSER